MKTDLMDIMDRMNEHLDALDHLTNTAPKSLSSCLYMLERELQTTYDLLEEFREAAIDEEHEHELPPLPCVREMILKAAAEQGI